MSLQIKIIAALLASIALVAAVLGYGHRQYTQGVKHTTDAYDAAIQHQKAQAAQLLVDETAKTLAAERALQDRKNQQEIKDEQNRKTVSGLADRLRAAAGSVGRLRDPNAPAGCRLGSGGTPGATAAAPADRATDPAQTGGLLSVPLSDLLRRALREADDINAAYASCREDAYTVRALD